MLTIHVSYYCFQYNLVCFCQSKSFTLWHFIYWAISLWWTWTVTNVSIFVRRREVSIGCRHIVVNYWSIFSIYFFFDYNAPLFYLRPFSKASVNLCVQIIWIPIKATWEREPFTKTYRGWAITLTAAILQCYLIVYCISFSKLLSHDSIKPSHFTGAVSWTFYVPPDYCIMVTIVF